MFDGRKVEYWISYFIMLNDMYMVVLVSLLKSTPVICCSSIYGKISIVQLKTYPEVSVTNVDNQLTYKMSILM